MILLSAGRIAAGDASDTARDQNAILSRFFLGDLKLIYSTRSKFGLLFIRFVDHFSHIENKCYLILKQFLRIFLSRQIVAIHKN